MITLAGDCLVFHLAGGTSVPLSAEMISVEIMGDTASQFDAEYIRDAADAVFHYFKQDLGRESVTVAEFTGALEKVLHGLRLPALHKTLKCPSVDSAESDLWLLARECAGGSELLFFPRLREALRRQLTRGSCRVHFSQLRPCVKELTGTQRWTSRCRQLEEQILQYLGECLAAEKHGRNLAMRID